MNKVTIVPFPQKISLPERLMFAVLLLPPPPFPAHVSFRFQLLAVNSGLFRKVVYLPHRLVRHFL